jgi:hypothetical protein
MNSFELIIYEIKVSLHEVTILNVRNNECHDVNTKKRKFCDEFYDFSSSLNYDNEFLGKK